MKNCTVCPFTPENSPQIASPAFFFALIATIISFFSFSLHPALTNTKHSNQSEVFFSGRISRSATVNSETCFGSFVNGHRTLPDDGYVITAVTFGSDRISAIRNNDPGGHITGKPANNTNRSNRPAPNMKKMYWHAFYQPIEMLPFGNPLSYHLRI